jgi:hypothetical protein
VTQLRSDGLLLLEEREGIRTKHPALGAYLEIVEAILADRGHELYAGALEGNRRRSG